MLVLESELAACRAVLEAAGGYRYPASQTPWQEIQRSMVGQLGAGMVSEPAVKYQQIAQISGIPRDNH
jgi:dihydroxy-acid dehydratase